MIIQTRRSYLSEREFRKNRVIAVATSLSLHCVLILGLFFYLQLNVPPEGANPDDLNFGSSGGGGEEQANKGPVEFGPQQATQEDIPYIRNKSTVHLIDIKVLPENLSRVDIIPVTEIKPPRPLARKVKPRKSIIAENLPLGHVRHGGRGPGSGGGEGGGSGGGIGPRIGYSIDWGGTGGRRLLSGRKPEYPDGTDKQMVVVLEFSVLPDGSVTSVIPKRRYDELLERASISALQTWRFDPLPPQIRQVPQRGEASFVYVLPISER